MTVQALKNNETLKITRGKEYESVTVGGHLLLVKNDNNDSVIMSRFEFLEIEED